MNVAERFFFKANIVWLIIFVFLVVKLKLMGLGSWYFGVFMLAVHSATVGVLLVSIVTFVYRSERVAGVLHYYVYIIMVGETLMLLSVLQPLLSGIDVGLSAMYVIIYGIFIFYLFGFKVYLRSDDAGKYFIR
ncbi:hypothetical protein MNBD_GAMMA12-2715 [hydrothermal vent metagenome]|uniref:Uncharacterized protein n=1 Tax=hydrothermal vent metagenome TaxID=652676 RepID=A0A3B0YGK5_9ZZZZ